MNEVVLWLVAPELALIAGACVVLLIGLARSEAVRSCAGLISFLTVLAALSLAWSIGLPDHPIAGLGIRLTSLAWYVRLVALSIGLVLVLVHVHLPHPEERGELFSMILFSLAGVLLTGMADDLVLLFLAIELVSIPTYVLVSMSRSNILAQEAGVKYFFLGALAAAVLVYGFSFLYGASGTTSLSQMRLDGAAAYVTVGMVLAFAGIAFKIVAVPFHAYAADVYQGAASPVTGLLGFLPKLAGFVALAKLLLVLQPRGPSLIGWEISAAAFWFLWVAAAATMTVGNVLALLQSNVKRILAYSSISHSGYMLAALLAGPAAGGGPLRNGLSAVLFYIAVYGVMNLGVFAVLSLLQRRGREVEELDDLAGLAQQQPLAALALAVCVFSLMGMPPTAGFLGKVYVFSSVLSSSPVHPHHLALIVLAVIGVINAAVAAAYYLRIVAACYLRPAGEPIVLLPRSRPLQIGVFCCCLGVLMIGVWPQPLISMTRPTSYDLPPTGTLVERTIGVETKPISE